MILRAGRVQMAVEGLADEPKSDEPKHLSWMNPPTSAQLRKST